MRNDTCPHCGEARTACALDGPPEVRRCRGCGLLFLGEFPAAAQREEQYQADYYAEGTGERFVGVFEAAVRCFRRLRLRDALRRLPPAASDRPSALLDVGCGRGLLLHLFGRRGWKVTGTQVSRTAADACRRRYGVEVLVGGLPELKLPAAEYRLVTLYHVLEHLDRPIDYLHEIRRLLRPDGLLIVEVPDAGGLGFRVLGARNFCLDYPNHLFFFDRATLCGLLDRCGFVVVGERRFSLEYSPYTFLQNVLNALPGRPNRLYRSFMQNAEGRSLRRSPITWLHWALGGALAPLAFLLSLGSLVLPTGNTLRVYARTQVEARRGDAARVPAADEESG